MTPLSPLILMIEDEPGIRLVLRASLIAHGYQVVEAATGQEGLALVTSAKPDLILLDLGLPDGDGLGLIHHLRRQSHSPISVMSARDQVADKLAAFAMGVCEYLVKPITAGEVLELIRMVLYAHQQRVRLLRDKAFDTGSLRVDVGRQKVFVDDLEIQLTSSEYAVLVALIQQFGLIVTQHQLRSLVRGGSEDDGAAQLRSVIRTLRRKLEVDPTYPRLLIAEPGVGYRLRVHRQA